MEDNEIGRAATTNDTFGSALRRVAPALAVGIVFHVVLVPIGTNVNCQGLWEGGCTGTPLGEAAAVLIVGFLGTPLLVAAILRRMGQRHAARVAWFAQLLAIPLTLTLFHPLFTASVHGASIIWEIVTQAVVVPVIAVLFARRYGAKGSGR